MIETYVSPSTSLYAQFLAGNFLGGGGFFNNFYIPSGKRFATAVWTEVELTVGIFVACLPAARIFVLNYGSMAMAATGLSQSGRSRLPHHDRDSGNSSGDGHARGTSTSASKLRMPSVCDVRLSSSIRLELGAEKPDSAERTSTKQLTGWGADSLVELENVASKILYEGYK